MSGRKSCWGRGEFAEKQQLTTSRRALTSITRTVDRRVGSCGSVLISTTWRAEVGNLNLVYWTVLQG
eukprot:5499271-Amphidinium_carterae.1